MIYSLLRMLIRINLNDSLTLSQYHFAFSINQNFIQIVINKNLPI